MKTIEPGPPALPSRDRSTPFVVDGLAVGPGIAVGTAWLHDSGMVHAPEYCIPLAHIKAEQKRFAQAVSAAQKQMTRLQAKAQSLPATASEELGYLLEAYQHMLRGSRLIRGVEHRIEAERINAEAAVCREIDDLIAAFAAMEDSYLSQRILDIREVGLRLVRNLTKTPYRPFEHLPRNAVILGHELTPADTALLDPAKVAGFATEAGGAESHTAIMARSLGLPAVLGVAGLTRLVRNGDTVVIDGLKGRVLINPDEDTLALHRKRRADFLRARRALTRLRHLPAETTDGAVIGLMANIELPSEVNAVLDAGAEGVGLLRSEFLFMNRPDWPDEQEQAAILKTVVQRMGGRPVTIRVLDAGGDKLDTALGGAMPVNPALGLRAVRFLLSRPEVLEAQLAAILRAAVYGPVRILLPMVTTQEEIRAVRACAAGVLFRLKKAEPESVPETLPPIGAMIEIPGAALAADTLARDCDFFAIGTNDLTQYTLAIDRADDSVAHLFNPLHPAVLRLIQFTAAAGKRAGIPVSLCGEMAGDPRLSALLIGMGIHELSMSAGSLLRVKQRVRSLSLGLAQDHAERVMAENDPAVIHTLIGDMAERH